MGGLFLTGRALAISNKARALDDGFGEPVSLLSGEEAHLHLTIIIRFANPSR